MRLLTIKQKRLLDKEFEMYSPASAGELEDGVFEKLEKLNDTEILWQEVNRYLGDKVTEKLYVK